MVQERKLDLIQKVNHYLQDLPDSWSIEDLSKWIIALDNNQILKPETAELLWTPAKLNDCSTSPFGVGWIVDKYNEKKATAHSGGPALADVVRLPGRKITAIVLTNQIELRPFLAMKILDMFVSSQQQK